MASPTPVIVQTKSNTGTWIALGVGTGLAIFFGKKLKDYFALQSEKSALVKDQASTIKPKPGKKLFDLNGKPISSANISTIAADLEDALSRPVDDARAVRVFLSTPYGHVADLEKYYLERYGENLKARMISRLEDEYWIKVKFWFK